MKQFKLGTDYTHVMGYLNRLGQRLQTVKRTSIDQTGVGEYFIEEARKSGVKNVEGTNLSVPTKENIVSYLRQLMEEGRLRFAYDPDLINEMNAERFQLTKTGQTQFSTRAEHMTIDSGHSPSQSTPQGMIPSLIIQ